MAVLRMRLPGSPLPPALMLIRKAIAGQATHRRGKNDDNGAAIKEPNNVNSQVKFGPSIFQKGKG